MQLIDFLRFWFFFTQLCPTMRLLKDFFSRKTTFWQFVWPYLVHFAKTKRKMKKTMSEFFLLGPAGPGDLTSIGRRPLWPRQEVVEVICLKIVITIYNMFWDLYIKYRIFFRYMIREASNWKLKYEIMPNSAK